MIDELLLHIGPPRTGTTTIQGTLLAAAAESAELGTFIPSANGEEPGQHLPILREVIGDAVMKERYSFSQDTLSLDDVLRAASDAGCHRLLLSAEEFAASPEDVFQLLRAIGAPRVIVLHSVRPVVPWMLSLYAQYITYGLNEMATWPVERFAEFFAELILPASIVAVERWKDGPWEVRLRTMFLARSPDVALGSKFARLADLPVPLLPSKPANQRFDACRLHILLALNVHGYDAATPLSDRAVARERVLASLQSSEIPPHDCRCAQRLPAAIRDDLTDVASRLLPSWVSGSERILGDPAVATMSRSAEFVHSAYPAPGYWSERESGSFGVEEPFDGAHRHLLEVLSDIGGP